MINDNDLWYSYSGSLLINDEGQYNVKFKAIDFVGNESSIEEVDFEINPNEEIKRIEESMKD